MWMREYGRVHVCDHIQVRPGPSGKPRGPSLWPVCTLYGPAPSPSPEGHTQHNTRVNPRNGDATVTISATLGDKCPLCGNAVTHKVLVFFQQHYLSFNAT